MKKVTKKGIDLKKSKAVASKRDSAGRALMASAKSLKKAGDLLLKAVELLPENNTSLTAAADALINARGALIKAAQLLAHAGDIMPANKSMPPAAERLKALEYTLN